MPGALQAELAARAAAFEAQVAATLERWRRQRRERWDGVRSRVEALTLQLRVAMVECRGKVGASAPSRRDQVGDMLRWLGGFDRERQRLETEIWADLRAARAEDARWRREVGARAAELAELGRRLARELEGAVAEASAGGTTRVAETPAGRALARDLGLAREALARRVEQLGASIEAELSRLAGRGFPDMDAVLARFDAVMAGRLDAAAPLAATARPVVAARAPRGPSRKKARVPRFLLSRFYRPGGLRAAGEGVEITFTNPLGFCIIQGGDAVMVDGRPFPKEATLLDNGERQVRGVELSGASYLKFPKGGEIRVTLRGLALPPGPHRLLCSLELRKMGWVELNVTDQLT